MVSPWLWNTGPTLSSLLSADDMVLMASLCCDIEISLEWFATECKAAGMRTSTSKSGSSFGKGCFAL